MVNQEEISRIGQILNDVNRPLKERFRALFTLKNLGSHAAIEEIAKAFQDKSELLKHEVAYCLGQMGDCHAIPILVSVLNDLKQEPIVRHEAAEALGAIGDFHSSITIMKHLFCNYDPFRIFQNKNY